MWALRNDTPYAVDRTWVRDKDGRHHWVVVCKATFSFDAVGRLRLADEQLAPLHEPAYFGEPGRSSLRYEADLVAHKPGTDVLVNASAHAPGGRAVSEVEVVLRMTNFDKRLLVRGETSHGYGLAGARPSTPAPFLTRPIRYELAYGGTDTIAEDPGKHRIDLRNPVGLGFASTFKHLVGRSAPSIFYPHDNPSRVGPAGFGPIASYWSPRLELAGTYDGAWARSKKPLLPDDYEPAHLLCAPADQRPAARLRGGERLDLVNLTPAGALRLELPKLQIIYTTTISGRTSEHGCDLVTVVAEPDEQRLLMVWQGSQIVAGAELDYLDESHVREVAPSW